jgi:hypothetical protein
MGFSQVSEMRHVFTIHSNAPSLSLRYSSRADIMTFISLTIETEMQLCLPHDLRSEVQ